MQNMKPNTYLWHLIAISLMIILTLIVGYFTFYDGGDLISYLLFALILMLLGLLIILTFYYFKKINRLR